MIRDGTFSEAKEFGFGKAIICDGCKRQIDYVTSKLWLARIHNGLLYAGRVICCWCHGKGKK